MAAAMRALRCNPGRIQLPRSGGQLQRRRMERHDERMSHNVLSLSLCLRTMPPEPAQPGAHADAADHGTAGHIRAAGWGPLGEIPPAAQPAHSDRPGPPFPAPPTSFPCFHRSLLHISPIPSLAPGARSHEIQPLAEAAGDAPATPLARGVWRITTPMPFRPPEVHAYLAALDGGGWMLVDGGLNTDAAWDALDAGVRAAAGGWEAVPSTSSRTCTWTTWAWRRGCGSGRGAPVWMGRLDAERMAHAAAHPDDEADYRAGLLRRCGAPDEMVRTVEALRRGAEPARAARRRSTGCWTARRARCRARRGGASPGRRGTRRGTSRSFAPRTACSIAGDAVLPRITPTLGVNRQRTDPVGDYAAALDAAGGARAVPRPSRPRPPAGGRHRPHPRAARGGGRGDGHGRGAAGRSGTHLLGGGGRAVPGARDAARHAHAGPARDAGAPGPAGRRGAGRAPGGRGRRRAVRPRGIGFFGRGADRPAARTR